MIDSFRQLKTITCVAFLALASALTTLNADTIIETDTFSFSQTTPDPAPGGVAATTMPFSLTSADIANTTLDANFDFIDAGIEILVNGSSLFNTGPDVSQFNGGNPTVFTNTGATNLASPFGPRSDSQPRLTVASDSTGTIFSGPDLSLPDDLNNPAPIINYTPGFTVNDFASLLQVGSNQIEIVSLNNFLSANLAGDFTLKIVMPATSVPEPTVLFLYLIGASCSMVRRRRQR